MRTRVIMSVGVFVLACLCGVCVCVRARERQRENERASKRERELVVGSIKRVSPSLNIVGTGGRQHMPFLNIE